MRVSVRFFTSLREITGKKEETLELPNIEITVRQLLEILSSLHGKEFVEYVYDIRSQNVKGFLQFLVNGKSTSTTEGLETVMRDGDVLAILPPVGGG